MKTKQISAGSCGALLVCWLVICTACTGDLVSPDPAEDQGGALDGVPPKLDQAPPKLDHGAPPKLDHGAPPKLDKGPPPKLDQGTPPKLDQGTPPGVVPPLGGSSKGKGGGPSPSGKNVVHNGVSYILQVPSSYSSASPMPLMIVFSGTEGASVMAQNMSSVAPYLGLPPMIVAVLDGKATFGNGQTGAVVLDHVRSLYNVSNDRTYLLSESAGTSAGLQLGFQLRQSYFAAFWANDVNHSSTPAKTAAQLGFKPWGNAGPGGQYALANSIVGAMKAAGYRLPAAAPYNGTGAGTHGSTQQFMAAVSFFKGKSRQ